MAHTLRYLLHCYFHEDWDEDAPTWDGVVRFFVDVEPDLDDLVNALGELTMAAGSELADDERMYDVYDFAYFPLRLMPMRDWLLAMRDELAEAMRWQGRMPNGSGQELRARLAALGVGFPLDDAGRCAAAHFGRFSPLDDVVTVLADMTLTIASESIDAEDRAWLSEARQHVVEHAVTRWEAAQLDADELHPERWEEVDVSNLGAGDLKAVPW